jgi:hypothetical protein
MRWESLAHLVREVDVQPSHPGSSLHGREFGFLFSKKKKNRCRGFPYRISFQKKDEMGDLLFCSMCLNESHKAAYLVSYSDR